MAPRPAFLSDTGEQVIVVSLSTDTPRNLLPGALAYALPYEGVHLEVFCDRMDIADDFLRPYLLAHVFVHEISHTLQGIERHSEDGIMKAHWSHNDYLHMDANPLAFTEWDVMLIYKGLDARVTPLARGTLAASNSTPQTATMQ